MTTGNSWSHIIVTVGHNLAAHCCDYRTQSSRTLLWLSDTIIPTLLWLPDTISPTLLWLPDTISLTLLWLPDKISPHMFAVRDPPLLQHDMNQFVFEPPCYSCCFPHVWLWFRQLAWRMWISVPRYFNDRGRWLPKLLLALWLWLWLWLHTEHKVAVAVCQYAHGCSLFPTVDSVLNFSERASSHMVTQSDTSSLES